MNSLPKHIAFVMDGNRRWAEKNGVSLGKGHEKGLGTLECILDHCFDLKIHTVSLYAFSSENWSRPLLELRALFQLILFYVQKKVTKAIERNIRIVALGNVERFPKEIQKAIQKAEQLSAENTGGFLQIALNYGGREEIVRAAKTIALEAKQGKLNLDDINQESFSNYLYTRQSSYPDFLVRTSGEQRLSNFLLYQLAYTELYFTPTLWPDFNSTELDKALESYSKRERRFGARPEKELKAVQPL